MPGITADIISHKLSINRKTRPVKQRRRSFAPDRNAAIADEVQKLLDAGFIREVQYPEWLSNVVLVKKSNGKWRMCVDFTDLNKACPKDSFPLPRVDLLVDSTAGHEMLSFMDAFSGYNQILMDEADQEKTSFITDRGLYCYTVMPFGLKNAGATYQRLVNRMFKDQIGKNIEVYVDDMLVKSKRAEDHLKDLQQTFDVLKKYGMKLNPAKCTFGVSSGKFLGFMVSERGIEANPEKIRAIIDMQPPRTAKEMQKLAGKLAALNRFISRSTDRCAPFFKTLRKAFEWTEECAAAFAGLQEYLSTPPVLSQSFPGEPLYVYLAVSQTAVSSALIAQRSTVQQPVYYTSRALQGAEMKYPSIEKLAFALVTSARKLRPYFQAHSIIVLTEHPLRQALQKPETSGRLVRWSVELSEFDIDYRPRTAIKGQVIADFIAEFTDGTEPPTQEDSTSNLEPWFIDVDGSSNKCSSGAGLVITAPNGLTTEYAIRFGFEASNNVAEYEALLAGLTIALDLHAEAVTIRSDSKLVVGQLTGEFVAKGERMKLYAEKAWALKDLFKKFEVIHIPRNLNSRADQLARLATAPEGSLTEGKIPVRLLHTSSITKGVGEVNQINLDEIAWAKPEAEFLLTGTLPADRPRRKRYGTELQNLPSLMMSCTNELHPSLVTVCIHGSRQLYSPRSSRRSLRQSLRSADARQKNPTRRLLLANHERGRCRIGQEVSPMPRVFQHSPPASPRAYFTFRPLALCSVGR
jgi:ribonuclease HI